jgi:adenine phosphoribosyltransferase
MAAGVKLLRQVGAEVPLAAALIELVALGGRARLDVPFASLIAYEE